jgi:GTP-binding protein
MPKPLIAIVGRPNVGKSALFNRLVRKRIAIVEDLAGTTRDRLYSDFDIWSRTCTLIDTGGFDPLEKEGYTPAILAQTQFAIEEADLIVFLLDGHEEPTTLDFEIAGVLRRTRKPVIVAANKLDSLAVARRAPDYYVLRLGEALPVSAASGYGVAELTEKIEELLPPEEATENEDDDSTKVALVGRPNVGKSALTNRILGYERSIVSPVPGTTRDAVDTKLEWNDEPVTLIDTAGMRRKAKVKQDKTSVEYHMVLRSLRAIDRCDVAVLVLDAGGVAEQDTKIAGYAHEAGKAVLVCVNKWDVMQPLETELAALEALETRKKKREEGKRTPAQNDYAGMIARYLPFVSYAPIHFTSALTGEGVEAMLEDALSIAPNTHLRIPTSQLNDVVRRALAEHPAPSVKGNQIKIRYATQAETAPPKIIVFCNHPELVHFSYLRYLENRIRAQFPFRGVPLKLELRKSGVGDEEEAAPSRRNRPARAAIAERAQEKAAREQTSHLEKSRAKSTRDKPKTKVTRDKPEKSPKNKSPREKPPRAALARTGVKSKTASQSAGRKSTAARGKTKK